MMTEPSATGLPTRARLALTGLAAALIVTLASAAGAWFWHESRKTVHHAAIEGDSERVKRFIAAGADLNQKRGDCEATPLLLAVTKGRDEVVELLLSNGADVNLTSVRCDNQTPLHVAAQKGHHRIAALLVARGAKADARTAALERTPLHMAVLDGRKEIVELLVTSGADVNAKDSFGYTPLKAVSVSNYYRRDIVDILKRHGGTE